MKGIAATVVCMLIGTSSAFNDIVNNTLSVVDALLAFNNTINDTHSVVDTSVVSAVIRPIMWDVAPELYEYLKRGDIRNGPLDLLVKMHVNLTSINWMINQKDTRQVKRELIADSVASQAGLTDYATVVWIVSLNDSNRGFSEAPMAIHTRGSYILDKRGTCGGWLTKKYYQLILKFRNGKLEVWLRENYYAFTAMAILLWANIDTITDFIAGKATGGLIKQLCNRGSDYTTITKTGATITYEIGWALYTTSDNCDTTANEREISDLSKWAIQQADQIHMLSWCQRYKHGGSWWADVRFKRWEDGYWCSQNLWSIPCEST
ncbi:hypothetical protein BABINDRAFT_160255 [Babjeviella inositovora NRRL Y-12698]|uniref:Secreted protein CSS2 C-terminal domain-containing protein n=1 Tax=Babjeviella inositovora NRRL Y-12698 TaxID=984486 RepID=A0A1E3QWN1_9ASCO|nr:uncharacterized protein BABINDRAFT_160255 [Babjeviella inositovora NRRL Y-12698]ODQ82050.1 hypothetical protein BABINDRAFT_160255 [Babjeviella inositovora NRRL Y-12698]